MKRRDFLKRTAVTAAAGAGLSPFLAYGQKERPGKMAVRPFGRHADELSVVGFGGIVVMGHDQEFANRIVAESVERGVNYYDVAPAYGNGEAETKLGPALAPYRKDCFLACKTAQRDRAAAEAEFEQSLERLKTDYFDLYQLHAITDVEKDVESVFRPGGVMDLIKERKAAGQIRYVGFSAHSTAAALTALDQYGFDSALFPVNYASYYKGRFGQEIIDACEKAGAARLALKPMAKQKWPEGSAEQREKWNKAWYEPLTERSRAVLGLKWTLGRPVTAAIPPGHAELYRIAMEEGPNLTPITAEEEEQLKEEAHGLTPLFPVV